MAGDKVLIEIELGDGNVKSVLGRIQKDAEKSGKGISTGLTSGISSGLSALPAIAGAAAAAIGAALFSKASINAAIEQENSIQRLNQSLASAGRFSQEASLRFQNLASEIQNTTTIEDDAVLGIAALASNFAKTNEQAEKLTKAAIQLSAATGKDLNTSVEVLGKTLSGSVGLLGKSVPAVQGFTAAQLKAGSAIDAVLSRFDGSAEAQVNTFSGALTQAQNAFGDLLEEIGAFIVKDAAVIAVIKTIADAFKSASSGLSEFRNENETAQTFISKTIMLLISLAEAVNSYFVGPLELVFNGINLILKAGLTVIQGFLAGVVGAVSKVVRDIGVIFSAVADGVEFFSKDAADSLRNGAISKAFTSFREETDLLGESTQAVFVDSMSETSEAFDNILNVDFAGSTALFLDTLRTNVETAKTITGDFKNNILSADNLNPQGVFPGLLETFQLVGSGFDTIGDKTVDAAKKIRDAAKQAGATLIQGFGSGAGQAFAAFGKAVATGQDALGAFANSLLNTLGAASIQIGTNFILQGIAYQLAGLPNGGPLIAAGAALAAFGGVLSGIGGGASSAPATGTPGGSPLNTSPADSNTVQPDQAIKEPDTNVSVTINGDVLDSDETSIRIVDLLNEAFDKKGVKIRRTALA